MSKSKKVILLIVEGKTDEDTLSPVLKKIFDDCNVKFKITRGDITVRTKDNDINPQNAITKINTHIKNEMGRYGYTVKDMIKVIHLIDTDGAFIPDESVVFGAHERRAYYLDRIETCNPEDIQWRNEGKKAVVQRLRCTNKIGGIPYSIFFFSRNLEHVLHDIAKDLSIDEKIELADDFAQKYENDSEGFKALVCSDKIIAPGDYQESWEHIFTGTNSLKRFSNFHLIFSDEALFPDKAKCTD